MVMNGSEMGEKCRELMEKFIKEKPEVWYVFSSENRGRVRKMRVLIVTYRNEDIGEEERVYSKESK